MNLLQPKKKSHSGGSISKEQKDSIYQSSNPNTASTKPTQNLNIQAFNSSKTEPRVLTN